MWDAYFGRSFSEAFSASLVCERKNICLTNTTAADLRLGPVCVSTVSRVGGALEQHTELIHGFGVRCGLMILQLLDVQVLDNGP